MVPTTDAAKAVSEFLDNLADEGFGPDLAQKITIAATPVIVATVLTDEGTNAIG